MGTAESKPVATGPPRPRPKTRQVVIAGPSGVGKGTLIARLMESFPHHFGFSVSHTTRKPRPGEADGVDYHFTTRDAMQRQIDSQQFMEYADVHGRFYGTSYKAVMDVAKVPVGGATAAAAAATAAAAAAAAKERRAGGGKVLKAPPPPPGRICILDIDMQGVRSVKRSALNPHFVFVAPPSLEVLEQRLRGRATETEENVAKRLDAAVGEVAFGRSAGAFDVTVVNDELEAAFAELVRFLRATFTDLPEPLPPSARRSAKADRTPSKFKPRPGVRGAADPLSPEGLKLSLSSIDILQDMVQIETAAGEVAAEEEDGDVWRRGTGADEHWVMSQLTGQYHKVDTEAALAAEVLRSQQAVPGELAAASHSPEGWPLGRNGSLMEGGGAAAAAAGGAAAAAAAAAAGGTRSAIELLSIKHGADWALGTRAQMQVRWSWRGASAATGKTHTVELRHAHKGGGFRELIVDGCVVESGAPLGLRLWDGGSRHDFELKGSAPDGTPASVHCSVAICVQGQLLSGFEQFYTYHLFVNGRPVEEAVVAASAAGGGGSAEEDVQGTMNALVFGGSTAPASKATPAAHVAVLQRRKVEFIEFYKRHDTSMIPKVDMLLSKHRFTDVVTSLLKKYGEAPAGWEAEAGTPPSAAAPAATAVAKRVPPPPQQQAVETL